MLGERLSVLVPFEAQKLAAAAHILSPYLPLLFMGEEYGETAPFLFFTDHGDPGLIEAVRKGRKEEFAAFRWQGEPLDPQDPATCERSRLQHTLREQGQHRLLYELYTELLRLRKSVPSLANLSRQHLEVTGVEKHRCIAIRRWADADSTIQLFHYGAGEATPGWPIPEGKWRKLLDTADPRWQGPGSRLPEMVESAGEAMLTLGPWAMVLYSRIA
jgi:maltooligosyltrehalose trehalohydrolase